MTMADAKTAPSSVRIQFFLAALLASVALLPSVVRAEPYYCITEVYPLTVRTDLDSSKWDPDKCYNQGPNGTPSNLKMPDVNVSTAANPMCNPFYPQCPCNQVPSTFGCKPGKNTANCPVGVCKDTPVPGLVVDGICVAQNKCQGVNYTNLEGQQTGVGDIGGIVGQIFKGLLDKLMQGGSAGGGGTPAPGQGGCSQYYQVTIPSSDPCAIYTPPTSGSILSPQGSLNTSNQLLDALSGGSQSSIGSAFGGGSGASDVSGQIFGQIPSGGTQSSQSSQTSSQVTSQTGPTTPLSPTLAQGVTLPAGTRGDIQVIGTGATIFAGSRDVAGNTEVAGFYGADTLGTAQPQSLAARMCENRPWAASFVSYVIPPTFFDGLCTWRGYQVGLPPAPPPPIIVVRQTPTPPATSTPAIVPVIPIPTVPPEVDIWAAPQKVPLAARTSIFWNSKGVTSCAVTASDGNFSETALSGGAATVPITGTTVFTITCQTPSGGTVTESVTVTLAI